MVDCAFFLNLACTLALVITVARRVRMKHGDLLIKRACKRRDFLAVRLKFKFARNLEYRCCLMLRYWSGHFVEEHVINKVRLNDVRVVRLSLGPWSQARRPRVRPLVVKVPKGPDTPTGPEPGYRSPARLSNGDDGCSSPGPWDQARCFRIRPLMVRCQRAPDHAVPEPEQNVMQGMP